MNAFCHGAILTHNRNLFEAGRALACQALANCRGERPAIGRATRQRAPPQPRNLPQKITTPRVTAGRKPKRVVLTIALVTIWRHCMQRMTPSPTSASFRVSAMAETVFPPFTVTAAAIRQLELMGGRARVDGGCCGNTYVFTRGPGSDSDAKYGCRGAELFVSDAAHAVLVGATLDYSPTVKPARFRVLKNPNTPKGCPCNRSFGRDWPGKGQPGCSARSPMPWD